MRDLQEQPRGPEAFLFVAIVAASTWSVATDRPDTHVDELWPRLRPVAAEFEELADRELVTSLATATRRGTSAQILAAQKNFTDPGVLIALGFDLACASVDALEAVSEVSAAEWCQRWATATAGGLGVDPSPS